MMMNMLIMTLFTLTITFLFLNHPLSFGMILLIQTLSIALITGMMNFNFWFSYILFLIMVGGMLILFIYMTSVASNEKFKFSLKLLLMILTLTMMNMPLMYMDKMPFNMNYLSENTSNQASDPNYLLSLSKFINLPMSFNLMLIIIYLLITLIMVVKITNIQHGPLRQKF